MGAKKLKMPEPAAADRQADDKEAEGPVLVEAEAGQHAGERSGRMKFALGESRREAARMLPEVVRALAREAASGSVPHTKLFLELTGVLKSGLGAAEKVKKERTLEEILVEQWEREKAYAAEDAAKAEQRRAACA